ncbi:hypothetical protein EVAR_47234_1 [Eumeta japonica]|uniref:Uncharacterized protein n=1 Tax=Eumeta variegata TaxID=151549 RepID=A0A4C1XTW8_EUMVA|nr:hypothetical protein EVAR_47234_1 [Eumeta japonica]
MIEIDKLVFNLKQLEKELQSTGRYVAQMTQVLHQASYIGPTTIRPPRLLDLLGSPYYHTRRSTRSLPFATGFTVVFNALAGLPEPQNIIKTGGTTRKSWKIRTKQ